MKNKFDRNGNPVFADKNIKKKNCFVSLWNYFTTYEKIWLFVLWAAGITLSIVFPEDNSTFVIILSIITLMGGCSCELLLSKQSKWAFIVSFLFYDLTNTAICFITGRYMTALIEIVFWMPMLFVSFFSWEKRLDQENSEKVVVKGINLKKEFAIFIGILVASVILGFLFTYIDGMTEYWYLDAICATFNVCNGLFLWLRYKEQWIAWCGVIVCETIMWIIERNWAMLILEVGYLTNSIYGFIKWTQYIKKQKLEKINQNSSENGENSDEKSENNEENIQLEDKTTLKEEEQT